MTFIILGIAVSLIFWFCYQVRVSEEEPLSNQSNMFVVKDGSLIEVK